MTEERKQFPIKVAYAFGAERGLEKEINAIREMIIEWDSYTSSLRKGYLVELFEKGGLFDDFRANYWPVGNTPWGEKERRRVLAIKERYEAFLAGRAPEFPSEQEAEEETQEVFFPLESHLRDFIATNIGTIKPHGLALRLYVDSYGRSGVEYPTGVGPIDVLAEVVGGI